MYILNTFFSAHAASGYDEFVYQEEPEISEHQSKFATKTKAAFESFQIVRDRTKYLELKVRNLTFGEYTDQVLYVAPLITGKVEVQIEKFNIYYDYNSNKSGVRYKYKF
jgi:hypothetical protein